MDLPNEQGSCEIVQNITPEDNNLTGRVQHITEEPEPTITSSEDNNLSGRGQQLNETSETGDNYEEEVTRNHYPEKELNENVPQAQLLNTEQQKRRNCNNYGTRTLKSVLIQK